MTTLTLTESSRTPSTIVSLSGALDLTISLSGALTGSIEILLVPHPDGSEHGYAPYGDAEDHWISGGGRQLLDRLPERARRAAVATLAHWADDASTEAEIEVADEDEEA